MPSSPLSDQDMTDRPVPSSSTLTIPNAPKEPRRGETYFHAKLIVNSRTQIPERPSVHSAIGRSHLHYEAGCTTLNTSSSRNPNLPIPHTPGGPRQNVLTDGPRRIKHPPLLWQDRSRRASRPFTIHSVPKRPPPSPADAHQVGKNHLKGYQLDFEPVRNIAETRRPRRVAPSHDAGNTGDGSEANGTPTERDDDENEPGWISPPPAEAYLILRRHRVPKTKWEEDMVNDEYFSRRWTYQIEILQSPSRGRALGFGPLTTAYPALSAPLIVRLIARNGRDCFMNPILNRRLIHTTLMVDLVSPNGSESRSTMRVRNTHRSVSSPSTAGPSGQGSRHNLIENTERNLLGSTFRTAAPLTHNDERGFFFFFTQLVVRNVGEYALQLKLIDLAGPNHVGTSIGVTNVLATALTCPFRVLHPSEYPGIHPLTDLSNEFSNQGERNLGRRIRLGVGSSEDTTASPETGRK
ncbi:hypothetical protein IAR55_000065 [Kwoniella newhampshirensis]|uniref:Velvet domain-containing protein n=1 Tax=Kwoniella newhampshirensis TaxID=1651941 RepID=A0AAW0Z5P0_9TREE